jgi:alkylated DNA repair dioxygenase AlkB
MLVMAGATQQNWEHRVPKITRKPVDARVNLTCRWAII